MTYPAFRKRGEEVQVGDLVRHTQMADDNAIGLVVEVSKTPARHLVKIFWASTGRVTGCSQVFVEVLSASR